jgi:predicted amidohydrolase
VSTFIITFFFCHWTTLRNPVHDLKMKPTKNPRVALVQLHIPPPAETNPAVQFQRAAVLIRDAARDSADLVVLPEMALGFPPGSDGMKQFGSECMIELANFQKLAKVSNEEVVRVGNDS